MYVSFTSVEKTTVKDFVMAFAEIHRCYYEKVLKRIGKTPTVEEVVVLSL